MITHRGLRLLSYGVCTMLALSYWPTLYLHQRLLTREVPPMVVFPVNGLRIDLDSPVMSGTARSSTAHSQGGHTLLLCSADTCPLSKAVLPVWESLIQTLPFGPSDRVVAVSVRGDQIPRRLETAARARGVAFRLVNPVTPARFVLSTGINATPGTFVLDEESRLRLIVLPTRLETARPELNRLFRGD